MKKIIPFKRYKKTSRLGLKRLGLFCTVLGLCAFMLVLPAIFTSSGIDDAGEAVQNTITHARIGIHYSNSAIEQFEFSAKYGIEYGIQNKITHEFYSLGTSEKQQITVKGDNGSYYVKVSCCYIGGSVFADTEMVQKTVSGFVTDGRGVFVHYNNDGGAEVRVGGFGSYETAKAYMDSLNESCNKSNQGLPSEKKLSFKMSVVSNDNSVFLITDNTGMIICGYTHNEPTYTMGVRAIQKEGDPVTYMYSGDHLYSGVLEFRKLVKGSAIEEMNVINVLEIEQYIAACMSFEISYSWPKGAQRTFSIIVRTYLYGNLDRHGAYDFNLCGTSHCQVYRGFEKVDEGLMDSAQSTSGLVVVDGEGELAEVYYYSADGGCTVASNDVWNSYESYLQPVPTPWESYRMYGENGRTKWLVEYSPSELYQMVKGSCPNLTGAIAEVSTTLAEKSTYVNSITFTDVNGNSATVEGVGDIRSLFGFKSGNFIVGKAGERVRRTIYSLDCYDSIYSNEKFAYPTIGPGEGGFTAVTSTGEVNVSGYMSLVTSTGETMLGGLFENRVQVVTSDGGKTWLSQDGLPDILRAEVIKDTQGVTLQGTEGYFVFDGLGWGHGIGISQHGIRNLVEAGYSPEVILQYYFTGTSILGINMIEQ